MTAELTRGQNVPLSQVRLEIRVSAGTPLLAGATFGDEEGRVGAAGQVAHPGAPALPGVEVPRVVATGHRLAVDLDAVPPAVHRVHILLALPAAGPSRFGAVAAPFVTVTAPDGTELASYTLTGLDAESAVVALELYRRQGTWKVRAVGQGYSGGLAELLTDQGVPRAHELAATIHDAAAPTLPARSHASGMAYDSQGASVPSGQAPGTQLPGTQAPGTQLPGARPTGPYDAQTPHQTPPASTPAPGAQSGPYAASSPAQGTPAGDPYAAQPPSGPVPPTTTPPASPAQGAPPVDYTHPRRRTVPPPPPVVPVAGDATGWSMEERLYNQVWGMFEDLARSVAAYRSAVDFADGRMERELDAALADQQGRVGGRADAAREAARARHTELVDRAREVLDRDLAQLAAESDVVEPALPAPYAGWDNPVWHGYEVPMEAPMAVRLGELRLPESAELAIPLLVRLPLERGLWIDSGAHGLDSLADADEVRRLALETAVAHTARLLAAHPAGGFGVHVVDPAGSAASALAPLVRAGVLAGPPAAGAAGVTQTLGRLMERVDLVRMAVRAGAADALPPGLDLAPQLLVVNEFPHGFDDRAVNQLRYLADEGPGVGVHLMLIADRADATAYGPLLDPLWRSLLRLTPVPEDHLADPWVGHAWTYEPALVPPGSQVLQRVLGQLAEGRIK